MTLVDSFTASRIARTWAIRLQSPDGKGKTWKVLKHDLKNDILNEPTVYTVDICLMNESSGFVDDRMMIIAGV